MKFSSLGLEIKMMKFSNITNSSYEELCFLLDKGYSKKSALNFVANHHTYSENDRNILNRITIPIDIVKKIQQRRIMDPAQLENKVFSVDTYNQFTTFHSIKNNDPILLCRDGIFRDIFSVLHMKSELKFTTNLIEEYLSNILKLKPHYVFLFFDKQRSKSRIHSRKFQEIMEKLEILGECVVIKSVDNHIMTQNENVIFSHDSVILSNVSASFEFFDWFIKTNDLKPQIIDRFYR